MTDQSADLVTKIDVIPELEGLNSFDAAIERAIAKVNQLDAAIKRVNNLKPASPYAPTSTASMPSAATTAAVATIAATGANLVSRTPLADTVRKEAQKVARAAVEGTASGITEKISIPASNLYRLPHSNEFGGFLPPPGTGRSGGGFNVPPSGASGWSAGRAGGLLDPQSLRRGPFADMDFSPSRFSGEPLEAKKKPVAEGVEKATRNPFGVDNMLAGAGLTAGIIAAGNALADSLDSIQRQQAQIARLAQTTGDAKDAFFALNAAASDVKSDSGAFISTYTNMATATQKLGLSQEETIKATQGLVGALQLGGAETHTINDALYQMGQAFSSDRFGGDEFRSFMEAIGTMAPKVAEAFGTDVKGLRAMSQAGKLTSEIMIKAFQKMAATNLDLLKKQGWTWGQTMTVMKNDWQAFLAQATIGGEWQKFTDWAANTLIPLARSAEKEVAEFWSTLADESKINEVMKLVHNRSEKTGNRNGLSETLLINLHNWSKKRNSAMKNCAVRKKHRKLSIMLNRKNKKPWLMPLLLMMLLTGCAEKLPVSGVNSQPVRQAAFPQMPPEGRQPPRPQICLPTCTKSLTAAREKSLGMLMQQQAPGESANGHMKR